MQVGPYHLNEKLGSGGMGDVWAATNAQTGARVAVKLLRNELKDNAEFLARFAREARVLAKLDHPNLVPLLAVDVDGPTPYLAMKLIPGESLSSLLASRGRYSAREALPLLSQLGAGLEYLHARGFVHRDVKPANCIVAPDGHLTLLDFGLSRPVGKSNITLPDSDVLLGTPEYMAPEQVLRGNEVDHRADLYSLGAVAYRLLTGSHVFPASDIFSLVRSKLEQTPQMANERHQAVSEAVARVLARALATEPDARFQSAREFEKALGEAFSIDRTQTSTEQSVDKLVPVAPAPRRFVSPAAVFIIIALASGAGVFAWLSMR